MFLDIQMMMSLQGWKAYGTRIFRTDENGEICVTVYKNSNYDIHKKIEDN